MNTYMYNIHICLYITYTSYMYIYMYQTNLWEMRDREAFQVVIFLLTTIMLKKLNQKCFWRSVRNQCWKCVQHKSTFRFSAFFPSFSCLCANWQKKCLLEKNRGEHGWGVFHRVVSFLTCIVTISRSLSQGGESKKIICNNCLNKWEHRVYMNTLYH